MSEIRFLILQTFIEFKFIYDAMFYLHFVLLLIIILSTINAFRVLDILTLYDYSLNFLE